MYNKIQKLEFIADEASIAVLALSSELVGEHEGINALIKRMEEVGKIARRLIEIETLKARNG
ncbi:hypothetical protein DI392_00620 [Vibrio albus]|uniref:Uncharacterized protein n=1 Tax=Vibrio albus TaxID=2200953 RepID=A0A2U3BDF7_9VIBR|nr:hypothetical protein [Vibrio albus]PWI34821.1 hypothetical protein DI392_00620 [Vibrio albus]